MVDLRSLEVFYWVVKLGGFWVASPDLALPDGRLGLADPARWSILSYARGTSPHGDQRERHRVGRRSRGTGRPDRRGQAA